MGRKKTLIDSSYTDVIASDIKGIKDYEVIIKLKAIQACITHTESEVAEIFGIARSTLVRWIKNYIKDGIDGCRIKSKGHNPSKLTQEEKEKIKEWIINCKDDKGNSVHWTLKKLIKEISLVFNISITKTPLWITLLSMNLSLKKPRPQHHKSSPEQQVGFKKKH